MNSAFRSQLLQYADQHLLRTERIMSSYRLSLTILSLLFVNVSVRAADASLAGESLSGMEALTKQVDEQLAVIAALLKSNEPIAAVDLDAVAAPEFECQSLRPSGAKEVYRNDQLRVIRAAPPFAGATVHRGRDGLARALSEAKQAFAHAKKIKLKFKTIRVAKDGNDVASSVIVHYAAVHADHVVEQSADWSLQWIAENSELPRLVRIQLNDFEEVQTHPGQGQWFADCTEAVFAAVPSFSEQLMKSTRDWRSTLTAKVDIDFVGHIGIAVGDVNGDQLEDLFLCQPNGLPNRLYLQLPDGTVQDASARAGVDWLDTTRSALLLDLDNDGDQDLVCGISRHLLVMENDGTGKFTLRSSPAAPQRTYSICAADYDNDGDLDIYACGYTRHEDFLNNPLVSVLSIPTPYHDARNGGPNVLLRNDGDFNFSDATQASGLNDNNDRFSHAAVWEDFDNDGDIDLYVANDFGRNNLYQNQHGKFADVAAASGTEDMAAGMGLAIEDYNQTAGWTSMSATCFPQPATASPRIPSSAKSPAKN